MYLFCQSLECFQLTILLWKLNDLTIGIRFDFIGIVVQIIISDEYRSDGKNRSLRGDQFRFQCILSILDSDVRILDFYTAWNRFFRGFKVYSIYCQKVIFPIFAFIKNLLLVQNMDHFPAESVKFCRIKPFKKKANVSPCGRRSSVIPSSVSRFCLKTVSRRCCVR